jgi:hypothetical protein
VEGIHCVLWVLRGCKAAKAVVVSNVPADLPAVEVLSGGGNGSEAIEAK